MESKQDNIDCGAKAGAKSSDEAAVKSSDEATVKSSDKERVGLKKEINLLHGTSLMAGIMIGSGIFISPVSITHHCGSIGLSLLVWVASGLLTLGMALSYSELGIMFGKSGAEYSYFRYTVGQWLAFLYAWCMFIVINPACAALLSLTTASYIFEPIFPGCSAPAASVKLFGIFVIVAITALNSVYVRYVTRAQTFFMMAKIFILIVIIIAGIVRLCYGKTDVLESGFENTNTDPGAIAIAMYSGIFTFGGWQYIFMLIEEVQSPHKIVPRICVISFWLVTVIYVLTNVAYFSVMTPADMMASRAVAIDFGRVALGPFAVAIPIFVACSTIGSLNGSTFGGSRVTFAAARDGSFPVVLAMIHIKYLTPTPAVGISCLLTIAYILSGEAVALLEYLGFVSCVMSAIAIGVLLYLRWTEPNRTRPFKIPLSVPIITFVLLVCILVLGLVKDPVSNGIGLGICLLGLPVYLVFVTWEYKPKAFHVAVHATYTLIQKMFMVVLPEDTSVTES